MIAGFAKLQTVENDVVPALVRDAGVDWMLECAPAASPSPGLGVPRHRMLLGDDQWVWPCRLQGDLLPFGNDSLPAILLRHLFWLDSGPGLLREAVRCLRPGGLLVSVSANPWHRVSWRELGRETLHLPAWPRFLMQHARHQLKLQMPAAGSWRGFVPGIAPLLVIVARKPPRPASVRRLRLVRHSSAGAARIVPANCRAA